MTRPENTGFDPGGLSLLVRHAAHGRPPRIQTPVVSARHQVAAAIVRARSVR
jgi:hypothetical protein